MNIIFRLNYRTDPGQSIWLKYSTVLDEKGICFDQVIPLHWINEWQWETLLDLHGVGRFRLEYHYQVRQDSNGVNFDEWHVPRTMEVDLAEGDVLLRLDSWCSAGTADYAFETDAFSKLMPARRLFGKPACPSNANHSFRLRMAAVPEGLVPCLIGSVREIGDWIWQSAVPLVETAPNVWEQHLYLPNDWDIEYKYGLFNSTLNRAESLEKGVNRKLPSRAYGCRQWTFVNDEAYARDSGSLPRGAGVALPVFSLRGEKSLGVGEFEDLKLLGNWAHGVGLKLIQILPINDTTSSNDWTDSYPYSAISVFALHPIYLRIDRLDFRMSAAFIKELKSARDRLNALEQLDYEAVMRVKTKLTRQIFKKHRVGILAGAAFSEFLEANGEWAIPYAVFCVQRDHYGSADFSGWGDWSTYDRARVHELAEPDHPRWPEVAYHLWLQCELDRQLADAVSHLHDLGLALKGDLPIGIDRQSVEAWSAPHLFKMDAQAGAPPDAFALKGQNWGFPTYHWEVMKNDGYAWWRSRFAQLSHYFDAYRMDHILGFFRIWQIPCDQVEGIMGHFDPALPIHIDEIRSRGIHFDFERYCRPYIREHSLRERFGDAVGYVKGQFLEECGAGRFRLSDRVATQRRIDDHIRENPHDDFIRDALLDCASEVLFFEVPGSEGTLFHPRCSMQSTRSYQELAADERASLEDLYQDYFYRRQENFWQARGYEKLPAMRNASSMLLCGEDLGMVPACVPGVLKELGILSLEIQRMPKSPETEFFDLRKAPYMSVVSPSTHDMSTLRGWWMEDHRVTSRFASQSLGVAVPEADLSGQVASRIVWQHLQSPAMWAIFLLQDLLAIDEALRHPDPEAERINIPAVMPFYWRYRMHLGLDQLAAADGFNRRLGRLIRAADR